MSLKSEGSLFGEQGPWSKRSGQGAFNPQMRVQLPSAPLVGEAEKERRGKMEVVLVIFLVVQWAILISWQRGYIEGRDPDGSKRRGR